MVHFVILILNISLIVETRFTGPRFIVYPDLSGLPPFSHIHGFTLDLG